VVLVSTRDEWVVSMGMANLCVFAECTASSAHLAIHIHLDIISP
jgi:hypothetical protein